MSAEFGTLGGKSLSSTLVGSFSLVGVLTEFGTLGRMSAMVVKFTPTVVKFTPTVVKFTTIGVCSLVGMSAEFRTLGEMLIGYNGYVQHLPVRLVW